MAKEIHLPVLEEILVRSRMTESQTLLEARRRRANVAGAFVADSAAACGLSVLLLDDVCPPGSTLQACAQALYVGGAHQVYALTLARAGWDPEMGMAGDSGDGSQAGPKVQF